MTIGVVITASQRESDYTAPGYAIYPDDYTTTPFYTSRYASYMQAGTTATASLSSVLGRWTMTADWIHTTWCVISTEWPGGYAVHGGGPRSNDEAVASSAASAASAATLKKSTIEDTCNDSSDPSFSDK